MGEMLRESYEKSHEWQMIYNGDVIGTYDNYPEMFVRYKRLKGVLRPDEQELLTYKLKFAEVDDNGVTFR